MGVVSERGNNIKFITITATTQCGIAVTTNDGACECPV